MCISTRVRAGRGRGGGEGSDSAFSGLTCITCICYCSYQNSARANMRACARAVRVRISLSLFVSKPKVLLMCGINLLDVYVFVTGPPFFNLYRVCASNLVNIFIKEGNEYQTLCVLNHFQLFLSAFFRPVPCTLSRL